MADDHVLRGNLGLSSVRIGPQWANSQSMNLFLPSGVPNRKLLRMQTLRPGEHYNNLYDMRRTLQVCNEAKNSSFAQQTGGNTGDMTYGCKKCKNGLLKVLVTSKTSPIEVVQFKPCFCKPMSPPFTSESLMNSHGFCCLSTVRKEAVKTALLHLKVPVCDFSCNSNGIKDWDGELVALPAGSHREFVKLSSGKWFPYIVKEKRRSAHSSMVWYLIVDYPMTQDEAIASARGGIAAVEG